MADTATATPRLDLLTVRPFLLTRGRTTNRVDLALEAQLETTPAGQQALSGLALEREEIVRLCTQPMSVAELAGRLDLPLQVSRVLVGDLIDEGFIAVPVPADRATLARPDLTLLERVLDGLQRL